MTAALLFAVAGVLEFMALLLVLDRLRRAHPTHPQLPWPHHGAACLLQLLPLAVRSAGVTGDVLTVMWLAGSLGLLLTAADLHQHWRQVKEPAYLSPVRRAWSWLVGLAT
jgi:hypothetical protein